jgi:MFS family permease
MAALAGLGMFLAALDISVNVALPSMRSAFATDLQTVQWVIVVFIATRAGLVMGAGSFADRFGLRGVYLFGAATYLAAMFAIAMSPTLVTAVGFRVFQALGTGCLYAVSPAMSAQIFPVHRRGLGMGFTAACQALGMLAGTLGAGLLVQWFGWEAVFLGRTPFALLALVLGLVLLPRHRRTASDAPFDLAGAMTMLAALLCLVIGLRLGRSVGWTTPMVVGLLVLAPVFLGAFWRIQGRATWPVLPRQLWRVPGFRAAGVSMFLAYLAVFVMWFIFPFYVSDGLGRGPLVLGAMLALMAGANIGLSALGGWLSDRTGPLSVSAAGLVVLTAGLLLVGLLKGDSSLAQVGVCVGVVGAGLGLFQAASYTLIMNSVPQERYGTASGALSLAQAFGMVLSVAVIGGIFGWSSDHHLAGSTSAGLTGLEAEARAFISAYRDVFWMSAGLSVIAGVALMTLSARFPRHRRGG